MCLHCCFEPRVHLLIPIICMCCMCLYASVCSSVNSGTWCLLVYRYYNMFVSVCVCLCLSVCVYIYVHQLILQFGVYLCIGIICMCLYVSVCMYVCMYTYYMYMLYVSV